MGLHHWLGLICATIFLFYPKHAIVYVWMQFGEVSTPFLNLWKSKNQTWACIPFAILFFLIRIVFQGANLIPYIFTNWPPKNALEGILTLFGLLFYGIQW
jgi:hypothetical protein